MEKQTRMLLRNLGISNLLMRLGFGGILSEYTRWLFNSSYRRNWKLIREDYRSCRRQLLDFSSSFPQTSKGKRLFIVHNGMLMGYKLEGFLGLVWRLNGFEPIVLDPYYDYWMRKYFRLFGVREFVDFQKHLAAIPSSGSLPSELIEFQKRNPSVQDLLNYRFRGVDVGRITLSNVLYKNKFSKFDISSPSTLDEIILNLYHVQQNVIAAENILKLVNPTQILLNDKGTSPVAELVGVCFILNIPVIQYVGSQSLNEAVFKRYQSNNRHQHPFSLDETTWMNVKDLPRDLNLEREIMDDLENGYREGTWFNRKFLLEGKRIQETDEVRRKLGIDPSKKTAVIFSHVLWDATFFYGKNIFEDYETWLMETVRAAVNNPSVNWVIKLHPDLVWKLKAEGYSGELRDVIAMRATVGNLPGHIKIVMPDTDISTFSFFALTDYCLTVRGTIGIEMACHGIPVLTAGTGRYSNLGFTQDFDTPQEYLEQLAHIQDIPPMSELQVGLARRYAYTLFKLRPWAMKSVTIMRKSLEDAQTVIERNLFLNVKAFSEFQNCSDVRHLSDWINSDHVDFLQETY